MFLASSTVKHARDLGVHVSFGHRSIPIAKKRAKRAAMRAKRIRGLAKKRARVSRLLFRGGAVPQSTCGHQSRGIAPTNMKRLRAVAARTTGGYRAGMCTTTLLATDTKQNKRLGCMRRLLLRNHVFMRDHPVLKRIERAWPRLLRPFCESTSQKTFSSHWFPLECHCRLVGAGMAAFRRQAMDQ